MCLRSTLRPTFNGRRRRRRQQPQLQQHQQHQLFPLRPRPLLAVVVLVRLVDLPRDLLHHPQWLRPVITRKMTKTILKLFK